MLFLYQERVYGIRLHIYELQSTIYLYFIFDLNKFYTGSMISSSVFAISIARRMIDGVAVDVGGPTDGELLLLNEWCKNEGCTFGG